MLRFQATRLALAVFALGLVFDGRTGSVSRREAFDPVSFPPSDLELREVSISREPRSAQLHILGRIYNGSPRYTATTVQLKCIRRDCVNFDCEVSGHKIETLAVRIPSGREQALDEDFDLSNVPSDGQETWTCSITGASGALVHGEQSGALIAEESSH